MVTRQKDQARLESDTDMSETWQCVMAEADFPDEGKVATKLGGWHVLIVKTDEGWSAVNDRCTHAASLLSIGRIRRGAVMCPLHGARFELASGKCLGGGYRDLRVFPLRIQSGMIEVAIPTELPGLEDLPLTV
jgi:anthranilate 1,2-dioxygenase ferredoxin subunit